MKTCERPVVFGKEGKLPNQAVRGADSVWKLIKELQ
jgi:hypothetical protein